MSFNLVNMSSTRDWVTEMLKIDVKIGDIRLRDGWETIFQDRGGSNLLIPNYKGRIYDAELPTTDLVNGKRKGI